MLPETKHLTLFAFLCAAPIAWTSEARAESPPVVKPAQKVPIQILVIEASNESTVFEERLAPLKKGIIGYTGASLLDELSTEVEPGSSVSLELKKKKPAMLKVTVRGVEDGVVKLTVAIDAFEFSANTTHKKGNATVIVGKPLGPKNALFLAVTPKSL